MTGGFVEVPHGEVFVIDQGAGPTTIVLSSGGMAPSTTMRPLADKLLARHRVITWDRANQGLSQVAFEGCSQLDLCAEQLNALLDTLGVGKAYLAGASEGGRVAFRTALRYPGRFSGLFLWQTSSGPVVDRVADRIHMQYAELAEQGGMEAVLRTAWYQERVKMNPSNHARILAMDPAQFSKIMRSWHDELKPADPIAGHGPEQIASMMVRTLVVAGVDESHPRSGSERLAAMLPSAEFVEAPYSADDWNACRFEGFALYAALPGLAELLEGFISRTEAQR
jgi:pimeloyl-ACP methyl ester carboxylesterase